MKASVKKAAGAGLLSLALVVGVAGFAGASSGTIGTTGPYSDNEISHESEVDIEVDNDNDVDLESRTEQRASSGDAEVKYNTEGGDATTGDAMNDHSVDATVEIDNSGSAGAWDGVASPQNNSGSINNTGPYSDNEVEFESEVKIDVDNDNDVDIENKVEQSAYSGDAEVKYNTEGGSATSGSVSNTSSSSFTVRITN